MRPQSYSELPRLVLKKLLSSSYYTILATFASFKKTRYHQTDLHTLLKNPLQKSNGNTFKIGRSFQKEEVLLLRLPFPLHTIEK